MSSGATAAIDRRRNAGPENSIRPVPEPSPLRAAQRGGETLDSDMMRRDGRYPEQVRPISMLINVLFILFSLTTAPTFPCPSPSPLPL